MSPRKPDRDECMCDFESRRFFGCFDETHVSPCPFTGWPDAPTAAEVEAERRDCEGEDQ